MNPQPKRLVVLCRGADPLNTFEILRVGLTFRFGSCQEAIEYLIERRTSSSNRMPGPWNYGSLGMQPLG